MFRSLLLTRGGMEFKMSAVNSTPREVFCQNAQANNVFELAVERCVMLVTSTSAFSTRNGDVITIISRAQMCS